MDRHPDDHLGRMERRPREQHRWRYDPVANTWTLLPTTGTPPARYDHSMAWDGNEVLLWGGRNASAATTIVAPDVWCFRKCP